MNKHDTAWKMVLDLYFPKFLEFFYPQIYQEIDWCKGYQSLDTELRKITRKATVGRRFVDKLMQVHSRTGNKEIVLIHVEIQGKKQALFQTRLFEYYCLLYIYYKQPLIVLVILIDSNANWRPENCHIQVWGHSVIEFKFKTIKLLDYREQAEELAAINNPFAIITLVQLNLLASKKDPLKRLNLKLQMTRALYEHHFTKKEIQALYAFIDWVMALPEELESIYNEEIKELDEEKAMAFITGMERMGIKKGVAQGLVQAKMEIAKKMLLKRFDRSMIQELTNLSDEDLEKLEEFST
jgi:hypothetical protein